MFRCFHDIQLRSLFTVQKMFKGYSEFWAFNTAYFCVYIYTIDRPRVSKIEHTLITLIYGLKRIENTFTSVSAGTAHCVNYTWC